MNKVAPYMICEKCSQKFCFVFLDSIEEGEIYECEFCNHIVLIRDNTWTDGA